jgi:hypothetical protein
MWYVGGTRVFVCYLFAFGVRLLTMKSSEPLKALLELPEMSSVGNAQERAAFIAVHIDRRTLRETAQMIGVSKSQVTNLATLFLSKLASKMRELERKRLPLSSEYVECRDALRRYLYELQEESGSEDYLNVDDAPISREDWAEMRGLPLNEYDE